MMTSTSRLPLGAVRTEDGEVVVPASRRADGSVRKPIRIRQGYVPQDEVPKYKPRGQRLREQANARATTADAGDAEGDDRGLSARLSTMTLGREDAPASRPTAAVRSASTSATTSTTAATEPSTRDLRHELGSLNRQLREIAKLERIDEAVQRGDDDSRPLSTTQRRRLEGKASLEQRRIEIVEILDGPKDSAADVTGKRDRPRPVRSRDSGQQTTTLRVIEL